MAPRSPELWTVSIPEPSAVEHLCRRAEDAGWDGIAFTDSQNLVADPFVAVAMGARVTERLGFMTGVTNAYTRHPAALATVAATAQEYSGGRFVLGIGRGDTALFHLGLPPQPVAPFSDQVVALQTYLSGGAIPLDGATFGPSESRLRWLERATQPKVPLDVAASGPKVLALAGRVAERVTLAVGAEPARIEWARDLALAAAADAGRPDAPSIGAYVVVGCHTDRDVACSLVRGALAAFMHFSAMPGSTGAGLSDADREPFAELGRRYDSRHHLFNAADHTRVVTDDLVDRHAIVGPPDDCIARLQGLAALGVERFVVAGPTIDADPTLGRESVRLLRDEVLPALR